MAQIKVKQVKSSIKRISNQKRVLESLGLRGIGKEVTHEATPTILGMIQKVKHLVSCNRSINKVIMSLENLTPAPGSTKTAGKRLGRGQASGKGGTAARGHKGAKSRSGYSKKIGFEGGQMPLQRRVPNLVLKNINRKEYTAINLDTLTRVYLNDKKIKKELDFRKDCRIAFSS